MECVQYSLSRWGTGKLGGKFRDAIEDSYFSGIFKHRCKFLYVEDGGWCISDDDDVGIEGVMK